MSCVNVVHDQILTGWAIILHISFTLNAGLKFNITSAQRDRLATIDMG